MTDSQMPSPSDHRARSEASGRSRSIMRCEACEHWSIDSKCLNLRFNVHGRRTSREAYCFEFDFKGRGPRLDAKRLGHDADRSPVHNDRSLHLERTGGLK